MYSVLYVGLSHFGLRTILYVVFSVCLRRNYLVGGLYDTIKSGCFGCWLLERECVENFINCFSWIEGSRCFKRNSVEFSTKSLWLNYFPKFNQLMGGVVNRYSNGLGCLMLCESLNGFRETETHLRAHGGCHMSTFPGRGVTW